MQPLPQGFELDQPVNNQASLPKGFVLDNQNNNAQVTQAPLPKGFVMDGQEKPESVITDKSKGYLNNVRNPIDLIKNESLMSNIVSILTGDTAKKHKDDKRRYSLDPVLQSISEQLGEMEQAGQVDTPEYNQLYKTFADTREMMDAEPQGFDMDLFKEAIKSDPGGTLAEFQNAILADPELLLTPLGWERAAGMASVKLAAKGKTIQKLGSTAAGMTGAAGTGAAVVAPISIAEQLNETGEVDPKQTAIETGIGAVGSAGFAGVLRSVKPVINKITKSSGRPVEEIESLIEAQVKDGKEVGEALDNVVSMFKAKKAVPEKPALNSTRPVKHNIENENLYSELGDELGGVSHLKPIIEKTARTVDQYGKEEGRAILEMMLEEDAARLTNNMDQPWQKNPELVGKYADELINEIDSRLTKQNKQAGQIAPALAITGGVAAGGAALGYSPEHPEGALAGAALSTAALFGGRKVAQLSKNAVNSVVKSDKRIRIDNLMDDWEGDIATGQRANWQFQNAINDLVPDKNRRVALSHWLENNSNMKLTPNEERAAKAIRYYFNQLHSFAKSEGVIDSYLKDYVPHLWQQGGKSQSEILHELSGRAKVPTGSKHAKERIIPTLQDGLEAGLKAKTLDIGEIIKVYGNAVNRAVRNKQLIESLSKAEDATGSKLIMRSDKAPQGYEMISHPSLNKPIVIKENGKEIRTKLPVKVHPDIVPSLKFVFEAVEPNIATRSALALNFAMKRSLVSMSGFHANALLESLLMTGTSPTRIPKALSMLRNGKAGDTVDIALKAGLKIGTIEDVGTDVFYGALKDIQNIADKTLITKPIKHAAKGYEKINQAIDNVMWDKIATGSKLAVFMKEYEKAILKNITNHKKNPSKFPLKDEKVIASEIAEFVNDAFGGQNWRRIAEGVNNKYGRDFALAINSPSGRRAMQLLMFAPDWTISNIRILGKALPFMSKSPEQAALHRAYFARGALMFATIANGINYMYTGKPIWENKDPSTVDLGDGRRMVFSKQFVEPFHWVSDSGKTALNKMGVLPKEFLTQAMNKEYLNPNYSPKMVKKGENEALERTKHVGSNFVPIFIQQLADQGIDGLGGFFGHPVYGKKKKDK